MERTTASIDVPSANSSPYGSAPAASSCFLAERPENSLPVPVRRPRSTLSVYSSLALQQQPSPPAGGSHAVGSAPASGTHVITFSGGRSGGSGPRPTQKVTSRSPQVKPAASNPGRDALLVRRAEPERLPRAYFTAEGARCCVPPKPALQAAPKVSPGKSSYRGVRQRPWGKVRRLRGGNAAGCDTVSRLPLPTWPPSHATALRHAAVRCRDTRSNARRACLARHFRQRGGGCACI